MINLQQTNTKHLLVHLHTTNDCNLDCSYCYNRGSARIKRITPKYKPNYLVDLLTENAEALDIVFYGGEPLLNVNFIAEVISLFRPHVGIESQFHIVTNGTVPFSKLNELGCLQKISSIWISFDGTKDTITRLRGDNVYDDIIENVKDLNDIYSGKVVARMTYTSGLNLCENVFEAGRFFQHVFFQCDNTIAEAEAVNFAKSFQYQFPKLVDKWLTLYTKGSISWLSDNVLGIWHHLHNKIKKDYYHCSPGVGCLTIDSNGNIYSCPEGETPESHSVINDCNLGNISDGLNRKKHELKARCSDCDLLWLCGGRCMWTDNESYCDIVRTAIETVKKHETDVEGLVLDKRILMEDFYPSHYSEVVP